MWLSLNCVEWLSKESKLSKSKTSLTSLNLLNYLLKLKKFPGNHSVGETPVPIPNTEVKPYHADDTARATVWESRSLPGFFILGSEGPGVRGFKWISSNSWLFYYLQPVAQTNFQPERCFFHSLAQNYLPFL